MVSHHPQVCLSPTIQNKVIQLPKDVNVHCSPTIRRMVTQSSLGKSSTIIQMVAHHS